jgi:hypothetical protein
MVAVEMGGKHRADAVRIDAEPSDRDQRRGTAIDQEGAVPVALARLDMEAGVEAPTRAESISAAENLKAHGVQPNPE